MDDDSALSDERFPHAEWRYHLVRRNRRHGDLAQDILDHVEHGWILAGAESVDDDCVDLVFRRPRRLSWDSLTSAGDAAGEVSA